MDGYWTRLTNHRIARRRTLAMAGASALGATLLVACGQDDDAGGEKAIGLLSLPEDTSKQAKRGGIAKYYSHGEPSSFDPAVANSLNEFAKNYVFSTLLQFDSGYMQEQDYTVIPDLAESWEFSPDQLQLTLKLRQGVKWHNKPPVNGRPFGVDDVLFCWERLLQKNGSRQLIANSLNPSAPIVSITASDARTILVKLAFPVSYVLSIIARSQGGGLVIVPKETDTTFDARRDMIGTGPFILANYEPSVALTYKRNPEYYDRDRPYLDQVDAPIITEYATQLAQFRAGNIYNFSNHQGVRQEDVIPTKKDVPEVRIYEGIFGSAGAAISFGFQEPRGGSLPFMDERVRRAMSMAFDRDLFINAILNVSAFEREGLRVQTRWSTDLGTGPVGWWLDPKGKDFGPNAQYFQYNIPEVKKLLAAAGFPNGLEHEFTHPTRYTPTFDTNWEIVTNMVREAGFRPKSNGVDYLSEFIPKYRDSQGKFEGAAFRAISTPSSPDPLAGLIARYHSKAGVGFAGFDGSGKGDGSGDPYVDSQLDKGQRELDTERRKAIVHDLTRYLAGKMYVVHSGGGASAFELAWPALRNYGVYQANGRASNARVPHYFYWLDETQPPFRT